MKPGLEEIEQRLLQRFPDARLSVLDDSHLHAGHTGSAGGAGHFTVDIVCDTFAGLGRLARHRLVYDAVADWMPHRIHALIVKASTPAESAAAQGAVPTISINHSTGT
ncbi:MAG: BolA family transcriptional regulator [Lautropia sp.]|nr:BolA family transcriptional regulator [Lautropia sp.]